jgi:membrane carboxypeptidase/penicillin-binding protein
LFSVEAQNNHSCQIKHRHSQNQKGGRYLAPRNNNDKKDGPLNFSADGYNVAAPIFKEFMEKALKDSPAEDFPIPEGIKQETVSKYNGKLISSLTPTEAQITDFFASFAIPTEVDDSYAGYPDFSTSETLSLATCTSGQAQKRFRVILLILV